MSEFEIEGHTYRVKKLDLKKQFHVARRLLPLVARVAPIALSLEKGKLPDIEVLIASIPPAVDGLAQLEDKDADYIIAECMAVCHIRRDNMWHQVWNKQADRPQYDDGSLSMFGMLRIVFEVVKESGLLSFSSGSLPSGLIGAAPQSN